MYKIQWKLNEVIRKAVLIGLFVFLAFGTDSKAYANRDNLLAPNASNLPPTVTVGADQTITIADRAFLYGVVSDDNLPNPGAILSVTWSMISGPGTVTFGHPNDFLTWATFSTTGTYVLRLTVSDRQLTSSDDLNVVVNPTPPHTIHIPQDYRTIQAGINAAQNGDLVLVSPGTYTENLSFEKTITLASTFYTTGNPSLIDQTVISSPKLTKPTILVGHLAGPETKIIGFTIKNGNDGILVYGKTSAFNNKFFTQHVDAVDYAHGAAGLIINNYCQNNVDDCVDINDANVLIENNQMVANGEGVEIRTINHTGTQLTIIIRDNLITGSRKTGLQLIDNDSISPTAAFLLIDHNLITNNAQSGLSLMDKATSGDDYRAASLLERIHLFNNTFVGNNYGAHGGDNLVAVNNIFVNHPGIAVKQIDGGSVLAHNLFWNNGTDNLGSNLDLATTFFADPLLDAEYKLQSGSPAIDAGVAAFTLGSGETVLNIPPGNYFGATPDLGKYESNLASNSTTPSPSPTPTNAPTATPTKVLHPNLDVYIGGNNMGSSEVLSSGYVALQYPDIQNGPVLVVSTNSTTIFTSERSIYGSSFNEVMSYPANQLTTQYYFPWYDQKDMNTWVLVGNPNASQIAHVEIFIAGTSRGTFDILPGQNITPQFLGVQDGPVKVISDINVFTSERSIYGNSFNEVMGYPANQLTTQYYFPWYDQVNMNTWLLVGNPNTSQTAHVEIFIAGTSRGIFNLLPGQIITPQFPGVQDGPVKVVSDINVFSSERSLYFNSFNEVMGYPANQLTTQYYFPWYDQVNMNTWVLVGNPSTSQTAHVQIFIAGTSRGTFNILPGQSITPQFSGVQDGPVKVVSDINVFTSERSLYSNSFDEVMGYPGNQLTTQYYFPWYDNKSMLTWVIVGKP